VGKEIYQEKIDTSNVNLQTRELHCNYIVYIQNLRKKMYTKFLEYDNNR